MYFLLPTSSYNETHRLFDNLLKGNMGIVETAEHIFHDGEYWINIVHVLSDDLITWETFNNKLLISSLTSCVLNNSSADSVQFSCSVVSDSLQPMNCSMPGLPVHHQLPEFTQTHVHWVGDAIQSSHPGSSPFSPAPNPSQHQSLFQWVNSSHEVPKVLDFSLSIIPSKEIPGPISFRMD